MTTDIEQQVRRTLRAIAETTVIPPAPGVNDRVAKSRRNRVGRHLTTVIAAGGIAVAGVGVAAATGVIAPGARQAFAGFRGESSVSSFTVDPRNVTLLAETPGPAGTEIAAYLAATSNKDVACVFSVVLNNTAMPPLDGGSCSNSPQSDQGEFEGLGGTQTGIPVTGFGTIATFAFPSGPATTGKLDYLGTPHAVAVANGYVVGWMPASQWADATLILRDQAGTVVGEDRGVGSSELEAPSPAATPVG